MAEPLEIRIIRKKGWDLNPDDRIVNNVFRALEKSRGHCPTKTKRIGHDQCPCCQYLEHNQCFCNLYVKVEESQEGNKETKEGPTLDRDEQKWCHLSSSRPTSVSLNNV